MKNKITSIAVVASMPTCQPGMAHAIIAHNGKLLHIITGCDVHIDPMKNIFKVLVDNKVLTNLGFEPVSDELREAIDEHNDDNKSLPLIMVKDPNIDVSFGGIRRCVDDARDIENYLATEIHKLREEHVFNHLKESLMRSRNYLEGTVCDDDKYSATIHHVIEIIDDALANSRSICELTTRFADVMGCIENSDMPDDILNSKMIFGLEDALHWYCVCGDFYDNRRGSTNPYQEEHSNKIPNIPQEPKSSPYHNDAHFINLTPEKVESSISELFDKWCKEPGTPPYISNLIEIAKELMLTSMRISGMQGKFDGLLSSYKFAYGSALNVCGESHKENLDRINTIVDSIVMPMSVSYPVPEINPSGNPVQKSDNFNDDTNSTDNPYGIFSSLVEETDPYELKHVAMIANDIIKAATEFSKPMGVYNDSVRIFRTACDVVLNKYGESYKDKIKMINDIIDNDIDFQIRLFDASIGSLNKCK